MRSKTNRLILVFLLSNIILISLNFYCIPVNCWEIDKTGHVKKIIDGDTFDLTTDERIRLADINTPETGELGADEATNYLTTLVYDKDIFIDVDDIYGTGPYGRTIAVIYVRYDDTYLKNVNKALLDEGHAEISDYDNEFDPDDWTLYVEYPSSPPPEEPDEEPTITPEITVTSPNASVRWYEGNTYAIKWNSQGAISDVKISLYKGTSLIEDIEESTENDGEHQWRISTTSNYRSASDYRICISDNNDVSIDDYSDYFSINYASISITNPSGSVTIKTGELYPIMWSSVGFVDTVSIELYKGTEFVDYITSSTENDGLFEWIVDAYETSSDYCIYIRDCDDSEIFDTSQEFEIENALIPMIIIGVLIICN